ncbi:plasma membrane ferric-chelate reductase (Fre2), putative [Talaromyces islandicus]|uniref:Plasma membrane ferric-chelate reductase (Fre2), putative n=1 Tax=Talaromyces islandicus TaxID=28573 RepID=A0A0U1LXU9_TALIS|nr:plasma membrane ferric-chelate reductase (Fre2), putative [Talaromyces islandicus]
MHLHTQLPLAGFLLLQAVCAANIIPRNERCVTAVYTALNYVSFTGEPAVGTWKIRCRNPLVVTSIYAAAEEYCENGEQTAGLAQLNSYCQTLAHTELLTRNNVAENLTDENVRRMRVVEFGELSRAEKIDYPVLVSPAYYGRTFDTIDTWQLEIWAHHAYGYLGYLYWGCVLLAGITYRLFHHANISRRGATNTYSSIVFKFLCISYQWTQKHLIVAFPFTSPNRRVLWFELPTRIEALVIAGFWLLSITLTCITYPLFEDNIYWPSTSAQLLRHIVIFREDNYAYYLWPAVIIWVSDRVLRLIRVIYCNFYVQFCRAKLEYTNSVAIYDEASNVVRLEVIPASSNHQPTASSYYYLYQPFRFRGWENHPFTLGSWTYTNTKDVDFDSSLKSTGFIDVSRIPLLSPPDQERENIPSKKSRTINQKPKLIFWIRPYDGWTRSLRDQCLASTDMTIRPTIFLEGPYGEPFPTENYDSVLLIAGGTGIACAVPYIKERIRQSETAHDDIEYPRRDIHLVWAAREISFIVDVVTRELQSAITSREEFSASFHSTSATSSDTFKVPSTTHDIDIDIQPGRPGLHQIILEHARETDFTRRSTVIVVSGPTKMADEARAAVQDAMHRGYQGIVFREESFSW